MAPSGRLQHAPARRAAANRTAAACRLSVVAAAALACAAAAAAGADDLAALRKDLAPDLGGLTIRCDGKVTASRQEINQEEVQVLTFEQNVVCQKGALRLAAERMRAVVVSGARRRGAGASLVGTRRAIQALPRGAQPQTGPRRHAAARTREVVAHGRVRVTAPGLSARCERLALRVAENVLELTGAPDAPARVERGGLLVEGPRFVLDLESGRLEAAGPLHARFEQRAASGADAQPRTGPRRHAARPWRGGPVELEADGGLTLTETTQDGPGRCTLRGPVRVRHEDLRMAAQFVDVYFSRQAPADPFPRRGAGASLVGTRRAIPALPRGAQPQTGPRRHAAAERDGPAHARLVVTRITARGAEDEPPDGVRIAASGHEIRCGRTDYDVTRRTLALTGGVTISSRAASGRRGAGASSVGTRRALGALPRGAQPQSGQRRHAAGGSLSASAVFGRYESSAERDAAGWVLRPGGGAFELLIAPVRPAGLRPGRDGND